MHEPCRFDFVDVVTVAKILCTTAFPEMRAHCAAQALGQGPMSGAWPLVLQKFRDNMIGYVRSGI